MFEGDLQLIWTGDGHFYLSFNNLRLVEFIAPAPQPCMPPNPYVCNIMRFKRSEIINYGVICSLAVCQGIAFECVCVAWGHGWHLAATTL